MKHLKTQVGGRSTQRPS